VKILGVDPGIDSTGFACIDVGRNFHMSQIKQAVALISCGTISPDPKNAIEEKFKNIHSNFKKLLVDLKPDVVVVEDIYSNSLHPKSGLKMANVKGVLELAVTQEEIKLANLTATRIKKALVGRGNASKEQVKVVIENIFDMGSCSNLHESDALAVALAYLFINASKVYAQ